MEDYELIKNYCWFIDSNGYVQNKSGNKVTFFHRLVMNAPGDKLVDHIYHQKNDNRKSQLRLCSPSENVRNRSVSHSSSGVCGVYWYSKNGKWSVEIVVDGKKINLGLFENKEQAIKVRKEAEEKYFGEFAYKERG